MIAGDKKILTLPRIETHPPPLRFHFHSLYLSFFTQASPLVKVLVYRWVLQDIQKYEINNCSKIKLNLKVTKIVKISCKNKSTIYSKGLGKIDFHYEQTNIFSPTPRHPLGGQSLSASPIMSAQHRLIIKALFSSW